MPENEPRTCPSCGARLKADAEVCDLCGTTVAAAEPKQTASRNDAEATPQAASHHEGPYCNQCGWQNPADANFCSKCGARLQDVSAGQQARPLALVEASAPRSATAGSPEPATPSPTEAQANAPGGDNRRKRTVGILVGASLLVVLALFLMLVWAQQDGGNGGAGQPPADAAFEGQPPAQQAMPSASVDTQGVLSVKNRPPLASPFGDRADSLKQVIAQASDKATPRRKLVNLYVGAGRSDLAALQERKIAQQVGTPEAWTKAGDRFYEWMMSASGSEKPNVAQVAANAYERVTEVQPDNLDVRTRLGWTYLQTRRNPMLGIQEIKDVIKEDPDHVPARMNYGIALAQIGRFEKAIKQFEHVKSISDKNSPRYQQAQQIIQNLRKQAGNGSS